MKMTPSPKFAAAFAFAFLMLVIGYLSTNSLNLNLLQSGSDSSYVPPQEQTEQQAAEDRPIGSLQDLNDAFVGLADNASPAVVTISTQRTVTQRQRSPFDMFDEFFGGPRRQAPQREFQQRGQGSGVIVDPDGIILTNNHVIANADTIRVRTADNQELGATIIGTDPSTDIAVLQVEGQDMPHLQFGDSDRLRVGEWVMAIGSPLSENLAQTVTQGIVSAKGRADINLVDFEDFIQTDAAINPGNSGGPLINMNGDLIGINTAIASRSGGSQGIGFAVPSNMAQRVMESIIETGTVVRGFLGLTGQDVTPTLANALGLDRARGIVVSQVMDESPAEKDGLQEEDVILEYDGRQADSYSQFRSYIASRAPDTEVSLKINRGGEVMDMSVTLGERPNNELTDAEVENLYEQYGFMVEQLNDDLAEQFRLRANLEGVVVTEIERNSQAYQQGLRSGDLIIAVNRRRIGDMAQFNEMMTLAQEEGVALFQVVRQNQQLFVAIEV
ncbi:MAG: DegQ family serine endoprotease [Cyclonatronaceae bacterium]